MKRVALTALVLGVGILTCMMMIKASSHSQQAYPSHYHPAAMSVSTVAPPMAATPAVMQPAQNTQAEVERVTAQLQQRIQELAELQTRIEGPGAPPAPGDQLRLAEQKQLLVQLINKDREQLEQLRQQAASGAFGSEFGGASPEVGSGPGEMSMMTPGSTMPGMMGPGDPLEQQIRHLQEAAEHLTAAGQEEIARDLQAKAGQLRKQLEARRNPQLHQVEQLEQVLSELRGLREEVKAMRAELQQLRSQPNSTPGVTPEPDSAEPVPSDEPK